jgi:hypothetical protein
MAAVAHTPGGYGGVPQSVGKEFNEADQAEASMQPNPKKKRKTQPFRIGRQTYEGR